MKRGWLGILPALLLLALYASVAGAQGGETAPAGGSDQAATPATPPAAARGGGFQTSQQFGFSIALPSGGTLLTPENSATWPWPDNPSVAFHWYGGGEVKEVIVHCYKFQAAVTDGTFKEFKTSLLDSFMALDRAKEEAKEKDKLAKGKEAVGIVEEKSFVLGDQKGGRNTLLESNDHSRWNLLAVKDQRHETPLGYSILSTYGNNKIYSVTLIYSGELTDAVTKTGGEIINSLSAPDVSGPFGIEPLVGTVVVAPGAKVVTPAATPPASKS